MESKNIPFEESYWLFATRIIIDTEVWKWKRQGMLAGNTLLPRSRIFYQTQYRNRLRDWMSTRKIQLDMEIPNHYPPVDVS